MKWYVRMLCVGCAIAIIGCGSANLEESFPEDVQQEVSVEEDVVAEDPQPATPVVEESALAQAEPEPVDTDGDGVIDALDVFPLDPSEWLDADDDGVGDNRDNCPDTHNPDQHNSDFELAHAGETTPEGTPIDPDGLGDRCDADRDGDGLLVTYVDGQGGSDRGRGTFADPLRTLTAGIAMAQDYDDTMYLAAGSYNIADIQWIDGLELFGGFAQGFALRSAQDPDPRFATVLTTRGPSVTLDLQDTHNITFDGMVFRNRAVEDRAVTIRLHRSSATFHDSIIEAAPGIHQATLVQAFDGSALTIARSLFLAEAETEQATGLNIDQSRIEMINSRVVLAPRHAAIGLLLRQSTGIVLHNTIEVGSVEAPSASALGVVLRYGELLLANNRFETRGATDQIPLQCEGIAWGAHRISHNYLSVLGGQGPQPLLIDCQGQYYFAPALIEDEITIDGLGMDHFIFASIHARADTALAELHGITDDYTGTPREAPYDLGATQE
jgi:hypothetical protein